MPGYSGTPLAKKLGIKAGSGVYVENEPDNYLQMVEPLPNDVVFARRLSGKIDMIHFFSEAAEEIAGKLALYMNRIVSNAAIWVSWPKKATKIPTEVTEDVIRARELPLGLV